MRVRGLGKAAAADIKTIQHPPPTGPCTKCDSQHPTANSHDSGCPPFAPTLFLLLLLPLAHTNITPLTDLELLSPTHVLAAVFRAVNDALRNRLRSRNVHSEIVFSLSPNNNVRAASAARKTDCSLDRPLWLTPHRRLQSRSAASALPMPPLPCL